MESLLGDAESVRVSQQRTDGAGSCRLVPAGIQPSWGSPKCDSSTERCPGKCQLRLLGAWGQNPFPVELNSQAEQRAPVAERSRCSSTGGDSSSSLLPRMELCQGNFPARLSCSFPWGQAVTSTGSCRRWLLREGQGRELCWQQGNCGGCGSVHLVWAGRSGV